MSETSKVAGWSLPVPLCGPALLKRCTLPLQTDRYKGSPVERAAWLGCVGTLLGQPAALPEQRKRRRGLCQLEDLSQRRHRRAHAAQPR